MSQQFLNITFANLSDDSFQVKGGTILIKMTDNPNFPVPWPDSVPSLAAVGLLLDKLGVACAAALTHDSVKIAERKAVRQELTDSLQRLAQYVEFTANGDLKKLASSGFDLRQPHVRSSTPTEPPAAPTGLRVSHGAQSGTLDISVDRQPNASAYEVQINETDASATSPSWLHGTVSGSCRHIPLEGLRRGQILWLRVRVIVGTVKGLWSAPVEVVVT